jgi:hypothetical protein
LKRTSRLFHIDDALFVLALMMPSVIALARYVESAARTRAIVLSRQPQRAQVAGTTREKPVSIALSGVPAG